jgi:hypothetical protein
MKLRVMGIINLNLNNVEWLGWATEIDWGHN